MKTIKFFLDKYFFNILLTVIVCLAGFSRIYQIHSIPQSLFIDEAGLGYNSWCLANYGVDRYLNEMPVYPQNFYGGQSPLYTYFLAFLIKIFGWGENCITLCRMPAAIFSILAVIFGAKLFRLIFKDDRITLMGTVFLTVCPFFFMSGRYALDCNLMLSCCIISLYFLVKYISCPTLPNLLLCGIFFGITLYSYAISYVAIAIFGILGGLYLLYTRKMPFFHILIWGMCIMITALPIFLFIISLLFDLSPYKFLCFTIAPIAKERVDEAFNGNFWQNMKTALQISLTYGNIAPDAVDKYYTMYAISIPFIILGAMVSFWRLIVSLFHRIFRYEALFSLFFLSCLITIGIFGINNAVYRGNAFFAAYVFFLVYGIVTLYRFLRHYHKQFLFALISCYFIWTFSFMRYYFREYEVASYPNSWYAVPAYEEIQYALDYPEMERLYYDCLTFQEYFLICHPESPFEVKRLQHSEGYAKYYFVVNEQTPLEKDYVYIVRKENEAFWQTLLHSGLSYHIKEFTYYNVVTIN